MNVFIIIPVYNEAKVIDALSKFLVFPQYHIVIVDDASIDKPLFVNLPFTFTLLSHSTNLGQGAALQTGMDFALNKNADIVVHFDADGQHNIDDIPNIIEPIIIGEANIVIGSRFLRNSESIFRLRIPLKKIIVLQIARYVQLFFTGIMLTDSQNGFRALSHKAASSIKISENRMAHAIEIIQLAVQQKFKVIEIPTIINYTNYSNKKGQKLINGGFIVIRLLQKMLTQRILLLAFSTFLLTLFFKNHLPINIFDILAALTFASVTLIVSLFFKNKRNINIIKTDEIRKNALGNSKYFNKNDLSNKLRP